MINQGTPIPYTPPPQKKYKSKQINKKLMHVVDNHLKSKYCIFIYEIFENKIKSDNAIWSYLLNFHGERICTCKYEFTHEQWGDCG